MTLYIILAIVIGLIGLLVALKGGNSSQFTNNACGSDSHYSDRKRGW